MSAFKTYAQCILGVLAVACALALSSATVYAQSTLDEIHKRGKLLAGVRFDAPPTGYIDNEGKNVGFGPDIAREFAKHLGVEVEFVQATSNNRIPLLQNRQVDAIIAGTTPNKTRDEVVDFSVIYNVEASVIMVRKGEPTNPEHYYGSDKTVGSMQGSFFSYLWEEFSPGANIKEYQEFPEVVLALAQGKVDVVPAPVENAKSAIAALGKSVENIEIGGLFYEDLHAIVLRENDSDWRDWVNWALQRMWNDGTFQEIYKKHFNADPTFHMGDTGRLQPGVNKIGEESDFW